MSSAGEAPAVLEKSVHRERVKAAIEALKKIFSRQSITRSEAVKILQEVYRANAVTPIRGKAWPEDLWDKEMATLYAIAKYVLRLDAENPDVFHQVFGVEEALEDAANAVLGEEDPEAAKRYLGFFLGGSLDDNTIARMLRVIATQVVLGIRREEDIERLLARLPKIAPELEDIARKYTRYYIALRVAQAIASGEVRNRIDKEAYKQALAAKIGLGRVIPDDDYIASIALSVYRVPRDILYSILSVKEQVKEPSPRTPREPRRVHSRTVERQVVAWKRRVGGKKSGRQKKKRGRS